MSSIGDKIDTLYITRQTRLKLEREAEKLKELENQLSNAIVNGLSSVELKAGRGSVASFSYKTVEVPNVINWPKVHSFIKETNNFSILQKRISETTWKAYKEDESIIIPGTEIFESTKVSLTKAGN